MAWNNPDDFVVAGTGEVYVAPVGTALPTNSQSALNASFNGLGYHTEDGVSVNAQVNVFMIRSWQSQFETRRGRDTEDFQLSFVLQQWNEINVPLAYGGGSVTSLGGGEYKYTPPAPDAALDERALVCDCIDGSEKVRFVVPRGSVVEAVASTFKRNEAAVLPITWKALQPSDGSAAWYMLPNSAAFASGS